MKKSRALYLHPDVNRGKVEQLDTLHAEYVRYVRLCVARMVESRRLAVPMSQRQSFFPPAGKLTSQIQKNARAHASAIISTWAAGVYARRIKSKISQLRRDGELSEDVAKALYTIGKKLLSTPWKFVAQEHLDAYWKLLDEHGGKKPEVRDSIPIQLSEMTAWLENAKSAEHADFWLRISTLARGQTVSLPIVGNPYVGQAEELSKGILARKVNGRWRFEAVENRDYVELPAPSENAPRLGVDVGLNVLAASSDGTLYGGAVKPKFDKLYATARDLRANLQRQGFLEDSPRLRALEARLTGLVKTETGRVANLLIARHPGAVFVLEDLDLHGCRGQKRFAYRALQTNLARKVPTETVNPAYTSQECPSCGYVHRANRTSTRFRCRSCGRKAHADWVGAVNVLGRSQTRHVGRDDRPFEVKRALVARCRLRRISAPGFGRLRPPPPSPTPLGRELTTRGSACRLAHSSELEADVP